MSPVEADVDALGYRVAASIAASADRSAVRPPGPGRGGATGFSIAARVLVPVVLVGALAALLLSRDDGGGSAEVAADRNASVSELDSTATTSDSLPSTVSEGTASTESQGGSAEATPGLIQPVGVDPYLLAASDGWSIDAVSYPVFFDGYQSDVFLRVGDAHEAFAAWLCHPEGCLPETDELLASGARRVGWEPWEGAGSQYWTIGTEDWTVLMTGAAAGGIAEDTAAISESLQVQFTPDSPTNVTSEASELISIDGVLEARLELSHPDRGTAVVDVRHDCEGRHWECRSGIGLFVVQGESSILDSISPA